MHVDSFPKPTILGSDATADSEIIVGWTVTSATRERLGSLKSVPFAPNILPL